MIGNQDIYLQKFEERGLLHLQFCLECKRYIFYPRSLCPHCWGANLEWRALSGKGRVFTYTIVNISALAEFNEKTPYIFAVIELDEGIKIPANIIDCLPEQIVVGMPVETTFKYEGGKKLPVFKPAG